MHKHFAEYLQKMLTCFANQTREGQLLGSSQEEKRTIFNKKVLAKEDS
jgi:hypothetical protein